MHVGLIVFAKLCCHWFVLVLSGWFCLFAFAFSGVLFYKGSGSHAHFRPHPCSSTYRWARLATHRHEGPHQECSPCSHAHSGRFTTACVSSPRDWAVSIGSHMQQDMDISTAPPHLGTLLPLFDPVHVRKPRCQKIGDH